MSEQSTIPTEAFPLAWPARQKTVTRREWSDEYAARFNAGDLIQAYDKQARFGGKKIGIIRLTVKPYKAKTCLIPETDWTAEGFEYMVQNGLAVGPELSCHALWRLWRQDREKEAYVVRFEVVSIEGEVVTP